MSELPGMWDESDLQGGESDCHEMAISMFANSAEYWRHHCEHARAENAALKEENERLKNLADSTYMKAVGEISALQDRVAELEAGFEEISTTVDWHECNGIARRMLDGRKEPANEGDTK